MGNHQLTNFYPKYEDFFIEDIKGNIHILTYVIYYSDHLKKEIYQFSQEIIVKIHGKAYNIFCPMLLEKCLKKEEIEEIVIY